MSYEQKQNVETTIAVLVEAQKNYEKKIDEMNKKIDKIIFILSGNGKVEDGMIFRVAKIESIQRECPIQELKKQTRIIVIAGIITVAIAVLKYLFEFLK